MAREANGAKEKGSEKRIIRSGKKEQVARSLWIVYPFGARLEVQKPAVPILSSGKQCTPISRPIAASKGKGRLVVIKIINYLKNTTYKLNTLDSEEPDLLSAVTTPECSRKQLMFVQSLVSYPSLNITNIPTPSSNY
ncbi:MAG: hypothetical protein EZS28_053334 [Streblomastix strix]|uniref:IFT52 GIFT domain-containing protein n=1 Tax=Streblomastix strix TaxID=222440 RepID=A0A5J4RCU3_9EUKA|nr:MAG: hypothetical protein EZS28_053334 [Streblomastix strix]